MTMLLMARPPFCVRLNKEDIFKLQCKLCVPCIKIEPLIIFKSRFLKSQSYKDNSDESRFSNLKIHRNPATIALHLYVNYKNITFNGKPEFVLEMSDKMITVPMEVEEGGIDAYMSDFQGMLDRLDNPSEVSGVGVGSCAGEVLVERESNAMGRNRGIEDGKVKPVPVFNSEMSSFLDGNGHEQTTPGSLCSVQGSIFPMGGNS